MDPAPPDPALEEIERAIAEDAAAQAQDRATAGTPAPAGVAAVASMMNPDLSFIADFALAAFSADEPLQSGAHDPSERGFNFQQLELAVGKAVDPYFRFDANLVFGAFGVEIEEAYATTLALPASLQLRAGQFLTRFGRINATHPHMWDFVDQTFVIGRVFGGEGNRGLGLELSYLTPLPWYAEVVVSATDAGGEATARSFYGPEDLGTNSPLDLQNTLAVKQFHPLGPDWSLLWGLSGAFGPNATGHGNRTDVTGIDLYLKYRPITTSDPTIVALQVEWLYRRRQIPDDVLADLTGYASLLWRFAQRWATALRFEHGTPSRARDGNVQADDLDPFWTGHRARSSVALTFWPSEFSRLRLQGSMDHLGFRDETHFAAFLSAEFVVGAHGAHRF